MVHHLQRSFHSHLLMQAGVVLILVLFAAAQSSARIRDVNLRQTAAALKSIPGATEQDLATHLTTLDKFNFSEKKLFQTLCRIPGLRASQLDSLVATVRSNPIRYSHVGLVEQFVTLPGCSLRETQELLNKIVAPHFVLERAIAALATTRLQSCATVFAVLDILRELDETGLWCAKQLFTLGHGDDRLALDSLHQIARMDDPQQRAAEKLFLAESTSVEDIPPLLTMIASLPESEAFNAAALFAEKELDGPTKKGWLATIFLPDEGEREEAVNGLTPAKRQILLHIYNRAAAGIIWRINSLHGVTDNSGYEIGNYQLATMAAGRLTRLFTRLHASARQEFGHRFHAALTAGYRQEAVALLKNATSRARLATAHDLTSSNIYLLLANGGELYDSSFRDVLVPVFKEKLASHFQAGLLYFVRQTDASGEYTADLITNLAQKGKLPDMLPAASQAQQQIIDLVAESALQSANSLLLFAATFPTLLRDLHIAARSRLLDHLYRAAHASTILGLQVRTILQYYYHHQPKLLTSEEKVAIRKIFDVYGPVELAWYTATPFDQWLADGRLRSLSSFAWDDDGRTSYISYSRQLLDRGYQPSLAHDYQLATLPEVAVQTLAATIRGIHTAPSAQLSALFQLGGTTPFVVDWRKKVNGIEIIQSTSIYCTSSAQERLLEIFFLNGDEMFAQRGHSYYRNTHLLNPLLALLQQKRLDAATLTAKQRFISLGSCGGIRAYSQLTSLLHNRVDIFGSIGTGMTVINNPYNQRLFELAAGDRSIHSWETVHQRISPQFAGADQDYIYPGSLPAILHKMGGVDKQDELTD